MAIAAMWTPLLRQVHGMEPIGIAPAAVHSVGR
jgi:hypothetical protein